MGNNVDIVIGLAQRLGKNIVQSPRKNDKLDRVNRQILSKMKNNFTYIFTEDNDSVFQQEFTELMSNEWTMPYIISNFFVNDYNECMMYGSYCNFTNCFRFELRWMIASLKHYASAISDFISYRKKYDNFVLLNKYEDALRIIELVDKIFGVSIWSGECKFFLYAKLGKEVKELLTNMPQTVVGAIFDFYELKNRENISSDDFFYIAEKEIRQVNRESSGENSLIEFFKYAVQSIEYEMTNKGIILLLNIVRYLPLIDQYLFFLRICDYALCLFEEDEIHLNIKKYIQELSDIKDEHLITVRFLYDNKENRKNNYVIKDGLEKAKEEFIKGNLINARKMTIGFLKNSSNSIEAINLLVDINVLVNDEYVCFSGTNLEKMVHELQSIYTFNSRRGNDLKEINKFILCTSFSTWSIGIHNYIKYRCHKYDEIIKDKLEMLISLQHLNIETIVAGLPITESIEYINEKLNLDNQYIRFRKACCEKQFNVADSLCNIKQIKNLLYACNDKNDIYEREKHLDNIEGKDAAIAVMGIRYFLATNDLEENDNMILNISSKLLVKNILTSLFIPLEKIVNYIDCSGEDIRKNIYSPILYYVYSNFYNLEKRDDLGIICEDFFFYNNIATPKQIIKYARNYDRMDLIFFLKNICTSTIMDLSVVDFSNSQERDQERVEICKILCLIDSDNESEYEKEIRELTRKLMIKKEHKTIEENKIHVNLEGIRENLIIKYRSDFFRYKFYLYKRSAQWTNEQKKPIFKDGPEQILEVLVYHIRNAFVSSNEYGLDGYLSLNIRHGTLTDELRSPLNKSLLSVKKDNELDKYIIDPFWSKKAKGNDLTVIETAIVEFFTETETIIYKLKKRYIQIKTEEINTVGLFDYSLYRMQLQYIIKRAKGMESFEEFLDLMFSILWDMTEHNLLHVKDIINNEIVEDYNRAFDTLKTKIMNVNDKKVSRELVQKTNEAATDMLNVLNRICNWFQRSAENKHNDFNLQFAFDLGFETVKNMHPEKIFIAKALGRTSGDKISGGYLKDYDGIFYILFNNIYKNAYSKDGKTIEIRYELKNQNGKQYIYLENDYDCTKDMTAELRKVKRARYLVKSGEYINYVTEEGGTGIFKICKIISYDLQCNAKIDFDYILERNIFFIRLVF